MTNAITAAQDRISAINHEINRVTNQLEMARNRLDVYRQCVTNMSKQERVDACKELGLTINGKPVTGRNGDWQVKNVLITNKERELNILHLRNLIDFDLPDQLRDAQCQLSQAEFAAQIEAEEVETAEPVEDDEELTPEDIAAIESAMSQEDMGPYTMEELAAMVDQAQKPVVGSLVHVKGSLVKHTWRITSFHEDSYHFVCELVGEPEIPEEYRLQSWSLDDVEVIPQKPDISIYPMCSHRYNVPASTPVEEIADLRTQMCPDCIRDMVEFEAMCEAEYQLERLHDGLAAFAQAVAMIAARDYDPFDVQGIDEIITWEKSIALLDKWEARENALDCGILPTEEQAATFDTSKPY